MARWGGLGAFLVVLLIGSRTTTLKGEGVQECPDLNPQRSLDIDQLMGEWYAVEIVEHNRPVEHNTISTVMDVCPILQLKREDDTTIRLQWNENAGVLVYKFRQPKPNHPGFWDSAGTQNGSLVDRYNLQLFSGTVQVMKAVSSHMVLTFCSRSHHNMFTVLMSRKRRLLYTEVRGVNNMLVRRGLVQGHVKEMCKGAAASTTAHLATTLAAVSLLIVHSLSSWH